jgi:DNA adenine methylase
MQFTLFDDVQNPGVTNVASVPQRSPFRYPGGKTWIIPRLRRWLSQRIRLGHGLTPVRPVQFIEPFVGGGSVSLTVAAENLADHVLMVELDADVASVWQTILSEEDGRWLAHEIETFDLTLEHVERILARTDLSSREQAFKTILRNRVNRGGILAPGVGLLKSGENGKGLQSRWYPATLKKRIYHIIDIRNHITFIPGDGMATLREHTNHPEVAFFIDPPYTAGGKKAGRRLYTHFDLDHEELFDIVSNLSGDFIMTYDNAEDVRALARLYNFDMQPVLMKNTHHAEMTELLIGKNLEWLRTASI